MLRNCCVQGQVKHALSNALFCRQKFDVFRFARVSFFGVGYWEICTFSRATALKINLCSLSLGLVSQILLVFVSLSPRTPTHIKDLFPLACSTKFKLTLITQPCGPKHILTWVHFPSAWYLKFYWCLFRSTSGHQHTYRICFPWPA